MRSPRYLGSRARLCDSPPGAANPTALVAPEAGGLITPIGVDNGSVFYRHIDLAGESSIRAINLDGTDARIVVGSIPGFAYAAVDEGMLVITLDCGGYQFFSTDGAQLPTPDWATECRAMAMTSPLPMVSFLRFPPTVLVGWSASTSKPASRRRPR